MASTTIMRKDNTVFNFISEEQLSEMLEQAVFQQLFLGQNRIMGRIPKDTMSMKDVGKILNRFINFIKENLNNFELENLDAFLGLFEAKFDMELGSVKEKVLANFKEMDLEGQEIIILYMILTKLLENLRQQSYIKYGFNQIAYIYNLSFKMEDKAAIRKKIQQLSEKKNVHLSLLYNLCFIRLLAVSFGNKKISTNSKRQITLKINNIFRAINSV